LICAYYFVRQNFARLAHEYNISGGRSGIRQKFAKPQLRFRYSVRKQKYLQDRRRNQSQIRGFEKGIAHSPLYIVVYSRVTRQTAEDFQVDISFFIYNAIYFNQVYF
jgi:hypothetical protein